MTRPADFPARPRHAARGFTLPVVLIVVAGLLILAVGLLLMTGIERQTARSFVDLERAELAARAGLEEVGDTLRRESANDDFLVIQSTRPAPIRAGKDPAPHLFIARGGGSGGQLEFRYHPLFSHQKRPENTPTVRAPALEELAGPPERLIDFQTLPYLDDVRVSWIHITDEENRVVSRYAYWVEDLQGRVDPAIAGNEKGPGGTHARTTWPFTAPGLNPEPTSGSEPALDQIALYAVDPSATHGDQKSAAKTLRKNRPMLVSPDSLLAAAEIPPPLQRLTAATTNGFAGDLADPVARAAERGLATGIRPYLERPVVPFAEGIHPAASGTPKLNLNRLLATGGDAAVTEMADLIQLALPEFTRRKGGFPDDYLKTLAASALDYADGDSEPTTGDGYRGIDAYPLVSEFLQKTRWENIRTEGGRKHLELSVTVYVELWNMTDKPVEGTAEVSYETKYGFQIPPDPNLITLDDLTHAAHDLTESGGFRWFPGFNVALQPNEYRVFNCGTVRYSFDAVSEDEWITSPLTLGGETYGSSGAGYRLRWNGVIADQSRGAVHRNDSQIFYPTTSNPETVLRPRQRVRATIPSHSHNRGAGFINNMGDPRMSFYNLSPQDANIYPQNYSPNRRNIRLGSVYTGTGSHNTIYGRVLPSEWPDGGHDSPFGTNTIFGLLSPPPMTETAFNDDHRIEPDDPRFYNQLPDLSRGKEEAPVRLSNLGRYLSPTELGRIHDPVMWQVRTAANTTNTPGATWGDVLTSSNPSTDHGGGNTLRIGRPEHPAFDEPGRHASRLLDLFHAGVSRSDDAGEREGPLVRIHGHVNINTAPREALRQLIAGTLGQDPEIRRFVANSHAAGSNKYPIYQKIAAPPDVSAIADRIAGAVIRGRPYASSSELARAREADGTRVFGNPKLLPGFTNATGYPIMQWTDAAAEETFARTYEASTVRSRNFRIWVIGQSVAPVPASASAEMQVLSEARKVYTVFADPGARAADGAPEPPEFQLKILHENRF